MINANALIEKFEYALDHKWGYIYSTAGIVWTEARQKQKVNYMVSKYGTSWQKNSEAKRDKYYNAARIGSKWIGHTVSDCSGLFKWAFVKLGGDIAHGSNSIYDKYCNKKGKLTDALKKSLLPGTAVFTGTEGSHDHIGLYVGSGKVIEAANTEAGVCTSNLSANKWTFYGELKNVDYGGEPGPEPIAYPTIRRGSKGEAVKKLQTILVKLGYSVGSCGIDGDFGKATEAAVKEFQHDQKITTDGVAGATTWDRLLKAEAKHDKEPVKETTYMVCIKGLDKTQATAIANNYPGAIVTEE
jgi:hypothetical protein